MLADMIGWSLFTRNPSALFSCMVSVNPLKDTLGWNLPLYKEEKTDRGIE
jgi:hypothetical protein